MLLQLIECKWLKIDDKTNKEGKQRKKNRFIRIKMPMHLTFFLFKLVTLTSNYVPSGILYNIPFLTNDTYYTILI